jgi:DNA-binding transcriptional regulator LsrR (DeoR family)
MGRTVPTYVQQISQQAEKWSKFRHALGGVGTSRLVEKNNLQITLDAQYAGNGQSAVRPYA